MRPSTWALAILSISAALAQTPTATLIGVVSDPAGLAIPAAIAVIQNTGTGEVQRVKTGAEGTFTVTNLPRGFYDVRIERDGFRTLHQTGIELLVDQPARLSFKLEIGAVSQEVTVKASTPLINTENAVRGDVIEKAELTEMPLQGRNFLDLAYLVPGVSTGLPSISYSGVVTNGARSDNTGMIVDGTPSRDMIGASLIAPVNLEAVSEFRMMTNNYSAQYGRVAGGMMSVVVKAGSNDLHGSAFLFSRDAIFDARSYFAPTKGDMLRNQYGGSIGGPVYIPRLYSGKNKSFFMVSFEQLRQNAPYTALMTVPTPLEKTGDFSQSVTNTGAKIVLKDPLATNAPFANAVIPANRVDPIVQKIMTYYPASNRAGAVNNYAENLQQEQKNYFITTKIDQNISNNNRLSINFSRSHTFNTKNIQAGYTPDFAADFQNENTVGGVSYTRIITPALIMELRSGLSRNYNNYAVAFSHQNIAQQLGISGTTTDPNLWAFPSFQPTGYATVGDYAANPGFRLSYTLTEAGTITWVKGKHVIRAGADAAFGQVNNYRPTNANGQFKFLGNWTSNSFADMVLGYADSTSLTPTSSPQYVRSKTYSAFVQDDFKLSSRLTLNLGLRYELTIPSSELRGRWSNYNLDLNKVVIGSDETMPDLADRLKLLGLTGKVVTAKSVGLPENLAYTPKKDFGPRIGVAWRPFGDTKTSIRAGWGIFYGANYMGPYLTFLGQGYPFQISQTFARNTNNALALTMKNPFPTATSSIAGTTNTNGTQWHAQSPYLQNFNFTIERELPWAFAVETAYSGSTGTHLTRGININGPYYYQPALWGPNNTITRPNPAWSTINYITNGSSSNFHAGLITVKRRLTRGFMLRFNYQFSKSIDDATDYNVSVDPVTDPRYARMDRAVSDNNQTHLASFSFLLQSPLHSVWGRNWQLSSTGRMGSGFPFSPQTQSANQSLGQSPRPDRLRTGTLDNPTPAHWFDVTAFTTVPNGAFRPGTAGRNILYGPGYEAANLSFSRNFMFRERNRLQIRVEAFNAFNHGNFGQPVVFINAVNGGSITSAQATRSMQLGARYEF